MSNIKLYEGYLTEKKLSDSLKILFPNNVFINNKKFKNTNYKPDFICEDLKLIIEFDGYRHYSDPKTIITDQIKDKLFNENGYSVIRIPYFIQLNNEILTILFNENEEENLFLDKDFSIFYTEYPQGFIDKNALLPASFCYLGVNKFINDLFKFEIVLVEILNSIDIKISNLKNKLLVITPEIERSIDELLLQHHEFDLKYNNNYLDEIKNEKETEKILEFYKEYKKLKGTHSFNEYFYYYKIFLSITLESYVCNNSPLSREESFKKWENFIGSKNEAKIYFKSIDNINSYS